MTRHPLVNLKAEYALVGDEVLAAMRECVLTQQFILGQRVSDFETAFSTFIGAEHCCGLKSGTAALTLTLLALGVKHGDEVLVPSLTFAATAESVLNLGANAVLCDVDPRSFLIDVSDAARKITPRTKGVIAVHMHGNVCDMVALNALCRTHSLFLIEDCAHAHGAVYRGAKAGTLSMAGCFSFFPGKILGACGDAGAVTTSDSDLHSKLCALRNHGRTSDKYVSAVSGYNERIDALQAAVLLRKMNHLESWIARRRHVASIYDVHFDGAGVRRQRIASDVASSYYVYSILVSERARIQSALQQIGVETGIYYPVPLHLQPFLHSVDPCVNAERASADILCLPMNAFITEADAEHIATSVIGVHRDITGQ